MLNFRGVSIGWGNLHWKGGKKAQISSRFPRVVCSFSPSGGAGENICRYFPPLGPVFFCTIGFNRRQQCMDANDQQSLPIATRLQPHLVPKRRSWRSWRVVMGFFPPGVLLRKGHYQLEPKHTNKTMSHPNMQNNIMFVSYGFCMIPMIP